MLEKSGCFTGIIFELIVVIIIVTLNWDGNALLLNVTIIKPI